MLLQFRAGGFGGVSAPYTPVVGDSQIPTRPLGLTGAPGNGVINWSWDQSADVEQSDGTDGVGVQRYPLDLNGAVVNVTAPTPNAILRPTLQQVGVSGSTASQSGTNWTLTGNGNGIDGTSDQVTLLVWQLTGDFKVNCRVGSFLGAGLDYAYTGLIVRESLAVGSKYWALYQWLSANNKGIQAKRRTTTNAGISSLAYANGDGAPKWLQIERTGNQVTYRYSNDGGTWTQLATETVTSTDSVYVGGFISDLGGAPTTLTSVLEELAYTPSARVSYVQTTAVPVTAKVRSNDLNAAATVYTPTVTQTPGTQPVGNAMKFRPGVYMWSSLQSYRPLTDPVILAHHKARLDAIASNQYIKGIQLNIEWSGWEGDVKGNFTSPARTGHLSVFDAWTQLLDYAASKHKCVMVSLTPLHFGNYGAKNYMFPAYLYNSAGTGTTYDIYGTPRQEDGFGPGGIYGLTPLVGPVDLPGGGSGNGFRGITAKIWQDATVNALNDVMTWFGGTFDSHQALEIVGYSESALNVIPGYNDDGYSNEELRRQVYRMYTHARACFPTTLLRSCVNDFGYDTPHMTDLMAFCYANQIIPGGPSVRRDDVTQADKVFVGKDEFGNQSYINYIGLMPWCPEVQDPEEALWIATELRNASISGYTATRQKYRLPGDPPFSQNGGPFVMPGMPGAYFIWPDQEYPTKTQWTRDVLPLINSTQGQTYYGNPVNTPAFANFFPNGTNRVAP
jgi:hypothetical protein